MTNLNIAKLYLAANPTKTAAEIDAAITSGAAATAVNALTGTPLLNAIYQALFNKNADAEGIAYWTGRMDKGLSGDALIDAIGVGATNYTGNGFTVGTNVIIADATIATTDTAAIATAKAAALVAKTEGLAVMTAKATAEAAATDSAIGDTVVALKTVVDSTTAAAATTAIAKAVAISDAAAAAYAEYTLPSTATPAQEATALAAKLNAATAAINLGATQDQIDAKYDALVEAGAAALTLANIITLDNANTAVSTFLAAVDTDIVDPTTLDDNADNDATTDDTVASAADVHSAFTTANGTLSGLVTGTADFDAESTESQTALYAAQLATLNNAVAVAQAGVTDAQAAIDDVDGLNAAIIALEAAIEADAAADAAAAATQLTLDAATAAFDAIAANGTPVLDTVSGKVHNVGVAKTDGELGVTTESYVITMSALNEGQSITIDGKTLTATEDMTAVEAAVAFAALADGALFTVADANPANAAIELTSKTVQKNVTDVVIEISGSETVFQGLAALKAAHAADVAADAEAGETQIDMVAANAAVAAIDPDTTLTYNATLNYSGTLVTTPTDATAMTQTEVAAEIAAIGALRTELSAEYPTTTYNATLNYSGTLVTTPTDATAMTPTEVAAEIDALSLLSTELTTEMQAIIDAGTSPLYVDLLTAETAVETAQDNVTSLTDAKAEYDALAPIDAALTALETTATTAAAAVADLDLSSDFTFGTDTIGLINNLTAGDDITITDFNVDTDYIYVGSAFTLNTGALTTGDNTVIEMFITDKSAVDDTAVITFETKAYGSESAGDFFTIELTGVATDEITFTNGMIAGA